jgi:NAD(P)-dependent dehydrogenase (short-subunit alcohol dehydrogenase family)
MADLLILGGTSGIGRVIAERAIARGDTVTIGGRDAAKTRAVTAELGRDTRGIAVDLAQPATIAASLAEVGGLDHVVITAIAQAVNSLKSFDLRAALDAVTVKLVGYTEALRVLQPRLRPRAAVVLFGGLAKDRPYPGSTMVTAFNGGVAALVKTLAIELAPVRVNAVHPGIVGDSPKWKDIVGPNHPAVQRTPIGRLVTMAEVADATEFLLRNGGMNGHNLPVEGGTLAT